MARRCGSADFQCDGKHSQQTFMALADIPGKKTSSSIFGTFILESHCPGCPGQAGEQQGQRAPLLFRALRSRGSIGKSNSPILKKEQKDNTVFTQMNKTCRQGNI